MIERHLKLLPVLGVAVVLLLAGCGSDDSGDSKDDFIAQADDICALGTLKIGTEAQNRFGRPQAPPGKSDQFTRQVMVPTLRTEVLEKLRALSPPEGDEEELEALFRALEEGIAALESDPGLLAEPDTGGAFDEANRLAQEYGFRQCGQG